MKNDDSNAADQLLQILACADYQPVGRSKPKNVIDLFDFEGNDSELAKLGKILSGYPSDLIITANLQIYPQNIPLTMQLQREEKHLTIIIGNPEIRYVFAIAINNGFKFLYWDEQRQIYFYRVYCGDLPKINGQLNLQILWETVEIQDLARQRWLSSLLEVVPEPQNVILANRIESLFAFGIEIHDLASNERESLQQEFMDITASEFGIVEDEALLSSLNYQKENQPTYFHFSKPKWENLIGTILSCNLLAKNRQVIFDDVPCELLPALFSGLFKIESRKKSCGEFELVFTSYLQWPASLEDIYRTISEHTPEMIKFQEFTEIWAMLCQYNIFEQDASGKYKPAFAVVPGIKIQ